jgi:toxin ParE1/3/4
MPRRRAEHRLSPAAVADVEAIWTYTAETWGIEQANRYTDQLVAVFAQLADLPQLGMPCDHIRVGYRRRQVGRHVIYYRLADYGIAIVRVLHDRMEPRQHHL